MIAKIWIALLFGLLLISCDTSKLHETPIDNFEGIWELSGRTMFDGIKIKIEKRDNGDLMGKVISLNDNKYVKMFVEPNDIWVTGISRSSNYEFKLTEKKIGSVLFSVYGLSTTNEYKVEFIDDDTIGLGRDNSDPTKSPIKYIRLKNE